MEISKLHFLDKPGAVLSDRDLRLAMSNGLLDVTSPEPLRVQPGSIDLTLARTLAYFKSPAGDRVIDLREPVAEEMEFIKIDPQEGYIFRPGEFVLGVTREWLRIPAELIGNLEGKSSLGRLGIVVHVTAGFFDPGFRGHGTLELVNLSNRPYRIFPGMPICSMRFSVMTSPAEVLYGDPRVRSKSYPNDYSLDPAPKPSEYYKNFENGGNGSHE